MGGFARSYELWQHRDKGEGNRTEKNKSESEPSKQPNEDDPVWVKAITPEETARRLAEPFMTVEEYRKQTERWAI